MTRSRPHRPQETFLFRLVSLLTRLQVAYLVRSMKNAQLFAMMFAVPAGVVALGIITAIAYLADQPLLFPPLAATTFVLFYAPLTEYASPRNVMTAHAMALFSGLGSLLLLTAFFPGSNLLDPLAMSWPRVAAITLAMGIVSILMTSLRCVHPPAAATAMIASMGFVGNIGQVCGFMAAVILLVMEALVLNKVIGGIPYPWWSYNPKTAEEYKELADITDSSSNFWGQVSTRIARRR